MNSAGEADSEKLSIASLERIDELCTQFENAIRSGGESPNVRSLLERASSDAAKETLFRELLGIHFECLPLEERAAVAVSYRKKFPDYMVIINATFGETDSLSVKDFAKLLVQSQLFDRKHVEADYKKISRKRKPASGNEFAKALEELGRLTQFQISEITAGRGKSLVFGNYHVLHPIGEGGMGAVFKARHRRMDRLVALKTIHSKFIQDFDAVSRFHREVKAAARLTHPNIVTAFDADEANGTHFLAMEFVDGEDLSILVRKTGPLSLELAVDCIHQSALGLKFAHESGVVHRDIKPSNLLLTNDGNIKILDMGLARLDETRREDLTGQSEKDLTRSGAVMGTVSYMAPEQALDSKNADARSDIYSLGCTFYFLIAGRPPYSGETFTQTFLAHREAPIPQLNDVAQNVPAGLDTVLATMIAKSPEDRYQSAGELLTALTPFLSDGEETVVNALANYRAPDEEREEQKSSTTTAPQTNETVILPSSRAAVTTKLKAVLPWSNKRSVFVLAAVATALMIPGIMHLIQQEPAESVDVTPGEPAPEEVSTAAPEEPPRLAEEVLRIPTSDATLFISFRPAGDLVRTSPHHRIQRIDPSKGNVVVDFDPLPGRTDWFRKFEVSNDLSVGLTNRGQIGIWSNDTGRLEKLIDEAEQLEFAQNIGVDISKSGSFVAVLETDSTRIFSGNGELVAEMDSPPDASSVAFSPDERRLVIFGSGQTGVWDFAADQFESRPVRIGSRGITRIFPDGRYALGTSGHIDVRQVLARMDLTTFSLTNSTAPMPSPAEIQFSKDGQWFSSSSWRNGEIRVWNTETLQPEWSFRAAEDEQAVIGHSLAEDGRHVAVIIGSRKENSIVIFRLLNDGARSPVPVD